MYAVIRSGGKQHRVSPGDVIRVEKIAGAGGQIETTDVVALRNDHGLIAAPAALSGVRVKAEVLDEGKAAKILVFHYKRKKQYKKLAGHRQRFTRLRILSIEAAGKVYTAGEESHGA